MKKITILSFMLLFLSVSMFGDKLPAGKSDWAILFSMNGLTAPFNSSSDGYQSGAALKYLLDANVALKALFSADIQSTQNTTVTILGLGAGAEYHFVPGIVSPFLGAHAGTRLLMDNGNSFDLYGGLNAGVEIMIYKNFSLTAEYLLNVFLDSSGFNIEAGKSAIFSLGIYF